MSSDLRFYRSLIVRRMPLMVTVFVLCSAIGVGLAMTLPPKYSASAQLLLESAQIESGGEAAPGSEQLQIIERRVMTRANLIDIANKYNVFDSNARISPDEVVSTMRSRVNIRSRSGRAAATTMTISFSAERPRQAANVVNELVTLVLQLDSERRVGIAEQALDFFEDEVARLDQELAIQSAAIVSFKEQNQGLLPSSESFRRDRLNRMEDQIGRQIEERKSLQNQRSRLVIIGSDALRAGGGTALSPTEQALQQARNNLQTLKVTFSDTNPRVRALEAQIAGLEQQVANEATQDNAPSDQPKSSTQQLFELQLGEIDERIELLDASVARTRAEVEEISDSLSRTPEIAIRLDSLERDYQSTLNQYNASVSNLAAASNRERIETLSKGQRITVIEQATPPSQPTSPNRRLIAGGGVALGTGLAVGVFLLLELLNRAVRRPGDIVRGLSIQPIATIPYLETSAGKTRRRVFQVAVVVALALGIPAALWALHMYYMPLDLLTSKVMDRFGF